MSKRIDCDRCMRVYREFRPAAVRIQDENLCLNCVRAESLEVEDGEPIVQPTPQNTPMGVPKVPDVPAPAVRQAAPVAEKTESEMEQPICKTCRKTKLRRSPVTREYGDECTKCKKGKETLAKPTADGSTPGKKRGPKPKGKTVQASAPIKRPWVKKTLDAIDATQHDGDMALISVPASFIQKYWNSLPLIEQAQIINEHMLAEMESRA